MNYIRLLGVVCLIATNAFFVLESTAQTLLIDPEKVTEDRYAQVLALVGEPQSVWVSQENIFSDFDAVLTEVVGTFCPAATNKRESIFLESAKDLNRNIDALIRLSSTRSDFNNLLESNTVDSTRSRDKTVRLLVPYCPSSEALNIVQPNETISEILDQHGQITTQNTLKSFYEDNSQLLQSLMKRADRAEKCQTDHTEIETLSCFSKFVQPGDRVFASSKTPKLKSLTIMNSLSIDQELRQLSNLFPRRGIILNSPNTLISPDPLTETIKDVAYTSADGTRIYNRDSFSLEVYGDPGTPKVVISRQDVKDSCERGAQDSKYPYESDFIWPLYLKEVELADDNFSTAKVGLIDFGFYLKHFSDEVLLKMKGSGRSGTYQTYGRSYHASEGDARKLGPNIYKYNGHINITGI